MGRRVVLVVGPPGAGKSTWVGRQSRPGDLVVDFDEIARRLGSSSGHEHSERVRRAAMVEQRAAESAVGRMRSGTAYVIRVASDPAARAVIAARIGATEVHTVDPGRRVVEGRLGTRPPSAFREVERWYSLNP